MNQGVKNTMAVSYVQFLNVGFGIINNTRIVDAWDANAIIEEALLLDNPDADIRIIGFRFYDIDSVTNNVVRRSGIYYLQGEIFTYPKVDNDVLTLLRNTNKEYEKGQRLIKVQKPYTLVYPFSEDDRIVDVQPFLASIKSKKIKEDIERAKVDIENYKNNLLNIIRSVADSIETNSFNRIPFIDSPYSEEVKYLNIMNDGGNFMKHIDYLRNQRLNIMSLEKTLGELGNQQ